MDAAGAVEHGQHLFRTQSAPLKPGGVVLSVLDLHGNALTATTGTDGAFAGTHMRGRMDFERRGRAAVR
ncbi:hypothetical protein GO497_09120 [Acidovorax citrulli]|nr:hypothetical protein [Paracidovorax citrulli]